MKITDNENNRWKGNAKRKKITRGTEAIAKGWEINDFVKRLI